MASTFDPLNYVSLYPTGADFIKGFSNGLKQGQENEQVAAQPQINQALANGDYQTAEHTALKYGDTNAYNNAEVIRSKQIAQQSAKWDAVGNASYDLMHYPVEQRQQVFDAVYKPKLIAQGVDPALLAKVDVTNDNVLRTFYSQALDMKTKLNMSKGEVVGNNVVNPYSGNVIYNGPPKLQPVTSPITGRSTVFNPDTGAFGPAAVQGGAQAPQMPGVVGGFGGGTFDTSGHQVTPPQDNSAPAPAAPQAASPTDVISRSMGFEGRQGNSYNPHDANGSPTNWGINWKSNEGTLRQMGFTPATFPQMTRDQAMQVYQQNYWNQSGAAKLAPQLQAPYFDVYIRSPKRAQQWLAQSGGDPAKFMQLAGNGFQQMAAANPNERPYAHAWANRDAANSQMVSGAQAPQGQQAPSDPYSWDGGANPQHYLSPDELKAAGYAPGSVVLRDPKGNDSVKQKPSEADAGTGGLNPDAIDQLAREYAVSGKMPPLGMGKQAAANRDAILNRAAEIAGAAGQSGQGRSKAFTRYRALSTAAQKLEVAKASVQASEEAAIANGQMAVELAKTRPFTSQFPTLNKLTQAVGLGLGDADVASFHAAVATFAIEYGKVMSGNGLGGQALSDSARDHALSLLEEGYNQGQLEKTMATLRKDMENRRAGFDHQLQSTYGEIDSMDVGRKPSAAPAQQAQAPSIPEGAKLIGYSSGRPVVQLPDGRKLIGPAGDAMPIGVHTPWGIRR